MNFFQAQKKLVRLWFFWGMILFAYVAYQTVMSGGVFSPPEVARSMWEWIGKYLASLFALIVGSSFFNRAADSPTLKDPIYFRLSFLVSVLYLSVVTVLIFVIIFCCDDHDGFLQALERTGFVLQFLLPLVTALLGYFFYKSKKESST